MSSTTAPGWLDQMTVAEMRRECRARSLGSGVEIAGWNQEQCRAALDGKPIPGRAQPVPAAQVEPIATSTAPAGQAAAAAQIAAALAMLAPAAPALDVDRVRNIAKEEAEKAAGLIPLRVTVEQPNREPVPVGVVHFNFPRLVKMLGAGVNVWLAGPAGTGKTTAAEQAAKALGRPFYFNGAIDSEHKLLGFTDAAGRVVSRPFRKAFTEGGVYLFDEVDASLPSALLAFNAALANGHCDFPDGNFPRHPEFACMAAANTWGGGASFDYVGRSKMDAAFLDRFAALDWPTDEKLERHLALACIADKAAGGAWVDNVQRARAAAARAGFRVVISPRASINGCRLLSAGLTLEEVENATLRKGIPADQWAAIKGNK